MFDIQVLVLRLTIKFSSAHYASPREMSWD